ncbi:uncharacterized protein LOC116591887 [Mustela erminea]|uniref:uncharacterized protein LOC116591887 n=1 Tax=Mustela erminea TaxID=36723 RepID=UPI00138757A5|nr:uncharacterized protein LOC116591887 [Mustela erminea]
METCSHGLTLVVPDRGPGALEETVRRALLGAVPSAGRWDTRAPSARADPCVAAVVLSCLAAPAVAEREGSPSPADAVGPVSFSSRPSVGFTRFGRRTGQSCTPTRPAREARILRPRPCAQGVSGVQAVSGSAWLRLPLARRRLPRACAQPRRGRELRASRASLLAAPRRHVHACARPPTATMDSLQRQPRVQPGDGHFRPQCCRAEASSRAL